MKAGGFFLNDPPKECVNSNPKFQVQLFVKCSDIIYITFLFAKNTDYVMNRLIQNTIKGEQENGIKEVGKFN